MKNRWEIFLASVFFVLGFSVIFSLVGVLLQTVLSTISIQANVWLGRIGGIVIIFFSLYLLGLIEIKALQKEYKFKPKKLKFKYLTAFMFGSAFAVAWTPCIGAILGAILTLAVVQPSIAFFLLLSYSLGLGIPFLLVGLFVNESRTLINKFGSKLKYVNYVFGGLLLILGILVFTNQLSLIANFPLASEILLKLNFGGLSSMGSLSIGIAFLAGIASFLSPCILPVLPAFLAYIITVAAKDEK